MRSFIAKFTRIRILIIVLVLLLAIVPTVVYWSVSNNLNKTIMFNRWGEQFLLAQSFDIDHTTYASYYVNSSTFRTNNMTQFAYSEALNSGWLLLNDLGAIDTAHVSQLITIRNTIQNLANTTYVLSLPDSQRRTLAGVIRGIGDDIMGAYTNYLQYTSTNGAGVPFPDSYNGPGPPDMNQLTQAYNLAINLSGLPPPPSL
jgi:hypothetical protein